MSIATLVLLAAATLSIGLVAGYVLGYANSVMPGLRHADDRVFVSANQHINEAVHNPVFMALSNIGPAALLAATIVQFFAFDGWLVLVLTLLSLVLYGVTLVLTLGINVPMNNRLIALGDIHDAAQLAEARAQFEKPWTLMNTARTWTTSFSAIAALVAVVLVAAA
ncbi:anthrone oxygenase family protein [Agromyces atrinae]|uniref:DUF1772 domain-containing protein n=1 Tax=Agromyces atrinae TaxID=592376 RepID=A0A4Q2M874_9MICO|nr:DUF1772 domain-containing protein [Agromyces atrinae]NYD67559.1 putative membrane protein [Agromyces atrinae]RXZ88228.1 DUF1772 domain-containing protein [Agromyces atrinae]